MHNAVYDLSQIVVCVKFTVPYANALGGASDSLLTMPTESTENSESKDVVAKPELKKILPTLTKDEEDPREDDNWRRDAEMLRDRPPHHG